MILIRWSKIVLFSYLNEIFLFDFIERNWLRILNKRIKIVIIDAIKNTIGF